jgi:replicative DNA helicase
MATDRRVPPHNLDAEQSLLGALLMSRDAILAVAELGLSADDFYKPAHRQVYDPMRVLLGSGEPVDAVTARRRAAPRLVARQHRWPGGFLIELQAVTPGDLLRDSLRQDRQGHGDEQDADLVMFIDREEVYNPDTP